jgi:hypothetical protein
VRKRTLLSVLAAAAVVVMLPLRGPAQGSPGPAKSKGKGPAAPAGPTPHMPDGKVDFSGVWTPGGTFATMGQVPLQAWADAVYKERRGNLSKDDPEGHCLPAGVPRISPFPSKIVQTPTLLVILEEGNIHSYRQIFMDGRGHPKDAGDLDLWMGDSIGAWDGDTLVVDSVGFNDKTWLNGQGVPHTNALHVIERMRRPDLGHIETEITLEDSKAFTKPHTFKRTHTLMAGAELLEYVCNEFNVDAEHLVGK